jgi:hypothetical protein
MGYGSEMSTVGSGDLSRIAELELSRGIWLLDSGAQDDFCLADDIIGMPVAIGTLG